MTVPGVIANMVDGDAGPVRSLADRHGVPFVGEVPLERGIEQAVGSLEKLRSSRAGEALRDAMAALGWMRGSGGSGGDAAGGVRERV